MTTQKKTVKQNKQQVKTDEKKEKTYLTAEQMKPINTTFSAFNIEVNKLPDSTVKKSLLSHCKYLEKIINRRSMVAEKKAIIKAIREGKLDVTDLMKKVSTANKEE